MPGVNLSCPRCGSRVTLTVDWYENVEAHCTSGQACDAVWNEEGIEIDWRTGEPKA